MRHLSRTAFDSPTRPSDSVRFTMRGVMKMTSSLRVGPQENARAWALMRDEFFGGVDVVPPCGT